VKTHKIKRYPTRKMYDSLEGRYVTLEDIAKFVMAYETVEIADSRTGEDITVQTLLQVVGDQNGRGGSPLLTEQTLLNLIRLNQSPVAVYWAQMIERTLATFAGQMQTAASQKEAMSAFNPFAMWGLGPDKHKKD
jgi:polyhydroxyalkanoate synthesis repressor PhaR